MNEAPQFGLLDVVEAFTAMRHEYRNQTKETREVAQSLDAASEKIDRFAEQIETAIEKLQTAAATPAASPGASDSRQKQASELALSLAEIDHVVSRSIEAATRSLSADSPGDASAEQEAATFSPSDALRSQGAITRFFCRRFAQQIERQWEQEVQQREQHRRAARSAIVSGLNMTADHLRRRIAGHGIERIDVLGEPFDGTQMRAVEVLDSEDVPPGHVAEQLSPAYRFEGRIILYADVRISRPQ